MYSRRYNFLFTEAMHNKKISNHSTHRILTSKSTLYLEKNLSKRRGDGSSKLFDHELFRKCYCNGTTMGSGICKILLSIQTALTKESWSRFLWPASGFVHACHKAYSVTSCKQPMGYNNTSITMILKNHSRSWGLLEKIRVVKVVKEFPDSYRIRNVITTCYQTLSWAK
jgi:hypothetical protein